MDRAADSTPDSEEVGKNAARVSSTIASPLQYISGWLAWGGRVVGGRERAHASRGDSRRRIINPWCSRVSGAGGDLLANGPQQPSLSEHTLQNEPTGFNSNTVMEGVDSIKLPSTNGHGFTLFIYTTNNKGGTNGQCKAVVHGSNNGIVVRTMF